MSGEHDVYERHVATPTGLDFAAVAALYGLERTAPTTLARLRDLAADPPARTLIHVATDRAAGLALHARVWAATPLSSGSTAASLTSVSWEPAAGSESATTPTPA